MTTLFDIGDTIELTMRGRVREYSKNLNGDCYVIELMDQDRKEDPNLRVYLDTESLIVSNAKKVGE